MGRVSEGLRSSRLSSLSGSGVGFPAGLQVQLQSSFPHERGRWGGGVGGVGVEMWLSFETAEFCMGEKAKGTVN